MSWQLILFGLLGACLGSFLNVLSLRYGRESSLAGRSYCPNCSHVLAWWELLPIVSFILIRGHCRHCGKKISWQYPLVEGVTALAWVWAFPSVTTAMILSLFVILFLIDLRLMVLPDIYILGLTLLALTQISYLPPAILGSLLGSGSLLALWAATRGRGLGLGDVKLIVPLGLLFGPGGTLVLLFLAFIAGGGVAAYLLLTKRATLKTAVPFGPYLLAAATLLLLWPNIPEILTMVLWGKMPA